MHSQRREVGELLDVVVALLGDDDWLEVVSPVHDTMTDVYDLGPVDACLPLETVKEVRKRSCVVLDTLDRFINAFCVSSFECERDIVGVCGKGYPSTSESRMAMVRSRS